MRISPTSVPRETPVELWACFALTSLTAVLLVLMTGTLWGLAAYLFMVPPPRGTL